MCTFPKLENASLTMIQGNVFCIEAKIEKSWVSCLKIIFLGVILCKESIARIENASLTQEN
jgi:hypothetical protein